MLTASEASTLLDWYQSRRRDLPWRRTRDPYRIWISEVMLQQTRVETVVPYYEAFLKRFPTVESLAAASVDQVLAKWSGLGYYRRARQLHQAAREIATRGDFPRTCRELEELPGIGPYTAAAVASIAFGELAAVLDGNVERLLSRYLASPEDPKKASQRRKLLAKAAEMLDPRSPGDGNQALMELGATVCTPRQPRCEICPIRLACEGRRQGEPERYPAPRRRREVERVAWSVAVVERRGRILFFRRAASDAVLAGTWELPNVGRYDAVAEVEKALASTYGGGWCLDAELFRVRHAVTYRALTLHVHRAQLTESLGAEREAVWIPARRRGEYAFSSMFEKVLHRWNTAIR